MDVENLEQTEPVEPCWPFWGLLKVGQTFTHKKINFEWPGNDYFERFYLIGLQALRMLERRTLDEIRFSAGEIQKEIDSSIEAYIENETNSLVENLNENGGYQLRYLPDGSSGTKREIRELLENWSAEFDDPSGMPKRDDLSSLDALSNFLEHDNDPDIEFIQLGLCEAEAHEFYAVLALMIICQASHSNPSSFTNKDAYRKEGLTFEQITEIGDATIRAVEIMGYADRVEFEVKVKKALQSKHLVILEVEVAKRVSERASKAAQKRHGRNDPAKYFVAAEWKRTCTEYDGNKTAFTRDYVRRVLNEFGITVTEKTMREVWLKDTPSAGKQAG